MATDCYRYQLDVEIPATDVAVMVDALEGEPFGLRDRIGAEELGRQLQEQRIHVDAVSNTRWPEFEKDVGILSVYLAEPLRAREICVDSASGGSTLKGWTIVARRGEVVRLPLALTWDPERQAIVDNGEDLDAAAKQWDGLPEWVRASLRSRHAGLGAP